MNGNTPEGGSTAPDSGSSNKLDPSREGNTEEGSNVNANNNYNEQDGTVPQQEETKEPESPSQSQTYAHLTPQPQVVGYPPYPSQVTPASPSPGPNGVFTDAYGAAFLRPGTAFMPHTNPFGGQPSPLSPPRPTNAASANVVNAAATGGVPPNSPLFPRLSAGGQSSLHPNGFERVMPQPHSPTLAYTTPGGGYQSYAGSAGHGSLQQSGSAEELTPGGWMEGG